MGTISVSLPADGTTADVADYNTPITTIVSEINGELDNANIASDAAISGSKLADASVTNAKLSTSTGEVGGAWDTWTPTWTNVTVGNGTLSAYYYQVGKMVHVELNLVAGSTTSFGNGIDFTLPATAAARYGTSSKLIVGTSVATDASAGYYTGLTRIDGSTTKALVYLGASGPLTSTLPFTETSGDALGVVLDYEAA